MTSEMRIKIRMLSSRQMRFLITKMVSFALVGLINLVIDIAFFALLYSVFHFPLALANLTAWLVVTSASYVMNSMFTFRAETNRIMRRKDYIRFGLAGIVGVCLSTSVLILLSNYVSVPVAKLASIGVGFVTNFTMSNFVVFRKRIQMTDPLL